MAQDAFSAVKRTPLWNVLFDRFVNVDTIALPITQEATATQRGTQMINKGLAQELALFHRVDGSHSSSLSWQGRHCQKFR